MNKTLFFGLRRGEVLGLTWDCVDLKNGTITINKQSSMNRSWNAIVRPLTLKQEGSGNSQKKGGSLMM